MSFNSYPLARLSVRPSACPLVRPCVRACVCFSVRSLARLLVSSCVCSSVHPFARLSICLSAYSPVFLPIRLSSCPSVRPSVHLSAPSSARPPFRPPICLSVRPFACRLAFVCSFFSSSVRRSARLRVRSPVRRPRVRSSVCHLVRSCGRSSVLPFARPFACSTARPSFHPSVCRPPRPSIRQSISLSASDLCFLCRHCSLCCRAQPCQFSCVARRTVANACEDGAESKLSRGARAQCYKISSSAAPACASTSGSVGFVVAVHFFLRCPPARSAAVRNRRPPHLLAPK